MKTTYTYAILKLSKAAYEEIRTQLEFVGYNHQFHPNVNDPDNPVIDMHGIAVIPEVETVKDNQW